MTKTMLAILERLAAEKARLEPLSGGLIPSGRSQRTAGWSEFFRFGIIRNAY